MKIGAQLYTVREFCKDLDSFAETLKRLPLSATPQFRCQELANTILRGFVTS